MWIELEDLYERKLNLQEEIRNFFDGDEYPNHGDMTYQRLLDELSEIDAEITDIYEKDNK